ncbi:MAG: dTDP-glucose 4,6-dehydratase [Candidatus Portnoybacteria bacterium]|nr:dTDP-glucose 4,6-dehydratase [Candidatus Portnoybacteria bacterium]
MNILVTGGAGFMGSHFIRYLLEHYHDVALLNLDKLTYAASLERLKDVAKWFKDRYVFLKGDIADTPLVGKIFKEFTPDIVVDFAAESHVDRSILEPGEFVKTDVLGTYTLLEAARKFGIKRYIKVSTDEVFGTIAKGTFTEESPFQPNSPYSASKAGGDLLCRAYARTYALPVIVTHFCNFIGPWQYPEKFIPLFITNLLENKKVPLYGKGRNQREWIWVGDVSLALDLLMQRGAPGEVYNIGTGEEKENWEIATQIVQYLDKDQSSIVNVKDRPGHDFRYALDFSKIKALGFSPQYSFSRALKETIEWYKQNRWWWEKIKQSEEFGEYYRRQYPSL